MRKAEQSTPIRLFIVYLEISISGEFSNPTPLSLRQLWALAAAALRELLWGLRSVSHELSAWQRMARAIPDAPIREDALGALVRKRTHVDGAALFSILPRRRNPRLLGLLVAYEIVLDFLDNVNERERCPANGRQLHLALVEALNPGGDISDHYRHHLCRDDGGYLRALVEACREGCVRLPGYRQVRALLLREATRALVLGINHDVAPLARDAQLRRWAQRECRDYGDASWYELSGAASASLTVHALLALAAEAVRGEHEIAAVHAAYFPWLSATSTMLDSYVDRAEDAAIGDHAYIEHYPTDEAGLRRVGELVGRSVWEARNLRNGHRHAVIAAAMVAMYLSKDSARAPAMRESTRGLVCAGGSLAVVLLPILRMWRAAHALCSA
jgi:tetraprenyl-beta-curcumene synthase